MTEFGITNPLIEPLLRTISSFKGKLGNTQDDTGQPKRLQDNPRASLSPGKLRNPVEDSGSPVEPRKLSLDLDSLFLSREACGATDLKADCPTTGTSEFIKPSLQERLAGLKGARFKVTPSGPNKTLLFPVAAGRHNIF